MKFARIELSGEPHVALAEGNSLFSLRDGLIAEGLDGSDLGAIFRTPGGLEALKKFAATANRDTQSVGVGDARFLTPIKQPDQILCVAANYREHVEETGTIDYVQGSDSSPWFFTKPQSSLNPHGAAVVLPARYGEKIDWEAELAIVIGKTGSAIAEEDVDDHIAGYTVFNDISARAMNVPKRTTLRDRDSFHDWLHGKWFDTFSCVGPWIVSADDVQNPQELDISLTLNGEMRQSSNTRMMIYPIKEMVSFISHVVTLQPGDIIATGTPSGVGKASGRFLADGDVLSVTVEGIGTLTNPVRG